jgi:hypothetical protein
MAKKPRKPQNAVLFHHPDAVDTSRPRLMCRHAAGEGFNKAFVRHSGVNGFHGLRFEQSHFDDFQSRIGDWTIKTVPAIGLAWAICPAPARRR